MRVVRTATRDDVYRVIDSTLNTVRVALMIVFRCAPRKAISRYSRAVRRFPSVLSFFSSPRNCDSRTLQRNSEHKRAYVDIVVCRSRRANFPRVLRQSRIERAVCEFEYGRLSPVLVIVRRIRESFGSFTRGEIDGGGEKPRSVKQRSTKRRKTAFFLKENNSPREPCVPPLEARSSSSRFLI